jgi:hypothetical protein
MQFLFRNYTLKALPYISANEIKKVTPIGDFLENYTKNIRTQISQLNARVLNGTPGKTFERYSKTPIFIDVEFFHLSPIYYFN